MSIVNLQVYGALKAYVQKSMNLLANLCKHASPVSFEMQEWTETQTGLYNLRPRHQVSWMPCIDEHLETLHATPEYSHLVATLRNDSIIGPQVNSLVGTALGRTFLDMRTLTDNFISAVVDKVARFHFDEGVLREAYEPVEDALYTQTIDVVTVAPLLNLDITVHPIHLGAGTDIDLMTDWEISRGISAGFFPHSWALFEMVVVPSRCAVRHRLTLPKVLGNQPSPSADSYYATARNAVQRAISTTRIVKRTEVFSPGYFTYVDNLFQRGGGSSTFPTGTIPPDAPKHGFSAAEIGELPTLFDDLNNESVIRHGPLNNAIRRYEYAGERRRPEDRIVDLMIAAESLFLHDLGSAQERGELRYRLALRTAFFTGSSSESRRQTFELMRCAYDIRSKVVHGDPPTSVTLGGKTFSVEELAVKMEETIRLALRKMIRTAVEKGGARFLVDWDTLILNGRSS